MADNFFGWFLYSGKPSGEILNKQYSINCIYYQVIDLKYLVVMLIYQLNMLKFYTNKELSQLFNINLAKWKRWSREFLPPDPLGGLQSGYARQYNLDETFTIYLGGHLVGDLKFTIPESRQILHDLHQWLIDHGFYFDFSGSANAPKKMVHQVQNYQIAIISKDNAGHYYPGLVYRLKATISSDSVDYNGIQMRQERFIESSISTQASEADPFNAACYRILNISLLRTGFLGYFQLNSDVKLLPKTKI